MDERGDSRTSLVFDSPVKRNTVELCRDEQMLDVDGLFRKNDDQPNELTDAQITQQQMKKFNRLLAKGRAKDKKNEQLHLVYVTIRIHRLID